MTVYRMLVIPDAEPRLRLESGDPSVGR